MERFVERRYLETKIALRFGDTSVEYTLILSAMNYISEAHRGEGRRKNKSSRLAHEREMVGIADFYDVSDPVIYMAIFLHDLVEDYRHKGWTFARIEAEFGRPVRNVVSALHKVRRTKGMSAKEASAQTFERVARGGHRAVVVKYFDRLHNLLNPWPGGERRICFKMRQTIVYLLPLAVKHDINTYPILKAIIALQKKYGLHTPYPG
jgi:(p)ppGpp synthase/HD superfamily hydrolase